MSIFLIQPSLLSSDIISPPRSHFLMPFLVNFNFITVSYCFLGISTIRQNKAMKALMYFFEGEVDRFISLDHYIDCRSSPEKLLRELRTPSAQRKLIKFLTSTTTNPLKIMRALTIVNLLLMYSREWFEFMEEHLKSRSSRDDWLNGKFLTPYYHFLEKCCTSREQYLQTISLSMRKGQALQMLFYCTNMLHLLFRSVEKMPFLGRYYKQHHSAVICSAVETIAAQAQRLYSGFKQALTEILYHREEYIKTKDDQIIMRGILVEELTNINQEMKKLFLDKYFYPLGKGIGVKLFRPEQQTQECQRVIKAIVSDHEDTERQKRHQQLEKTLFPGSGLVNWNFFEETLMAVPLNNTVNVSAKGAGPNFKDLDDLVISEEDGEEQKEKEIQRGEKGGSGKQTNSGTAQEKGYQI